MDLDLPPSPADAVSFRMDDLSTLPPDNSGADDPPFEALHALTQPTAAQIFKLLEKGFDGLTELPSSLFSPPSDVERPCSTEESSQAWTWQRSLNEIVSGPRDSTDELHHGQPFEKVHAEERSFKINFDPSDMSEMLAGVALSGASFDGFHGGVKDSEEIPLSFIFLPYGQETFLNLKWPGYNHLHLRIRFPFFHDNGTPLTYRELATRISKSFSGVLYQFCRLDYIDPKDGTGRPLGANTISLSQIRLLSICSDDGLEWFPNFSIVYFDSPSEKSE